MQFIKSLRERIRRGEVTCTVRIWQRAHVRVGGEYALPPGAVQVTQIYEISLHDITPDLARRSGFAGLVELLKVAKHGPGRRVFVVEFRYLPASKRSVSPVRKSKRGVSRARKRGDE